MAKRNTQAPKQHDFRNKLLLNQWLISLFGIDPLGEHKAHGKVVRPFNKLAEPISDPALEGFDNDNLHHFYHALVNSNLFWNDFCQLSKEQVLVYEQNIVRHTLAINEKRHRPVVWKYYQWLTLLFTEIYLDRFFSDKECLLGSLNDYVERFNRHWHTYMAVTPYEVDDLNKLCLQNATGSGKTLLMHVNLLQYRHYDRKYGKIPDAARVILLTPNERLSEQHITEFHESGFSFVGRLDPGKPASLGSVDVIEITKLGDKDGPNTIATRTLGNTNLLLVDEGHRGMSGKEEGAWFARRSQLCDRGFTFEYSATFEQAVQASGNINFSHNYAKAVLFDYSYRWFYEDGFGKDYQILNLPEAYSDHEQTYLTACLLKFYQQLRIYDDKKQEFRAFNIEKPLWVFVGSTVSSGKLSKDEQIVATDVALIIQFIADFLSKQPAAQRRIAEILSGTGQDTGLLDQNGNDIFAGSFTYLARLINTGETVDDIYRDILARLFNNQAGGILSLDRIKGDSGEIAMRVGTSEECFGLINVGDAKGLCDHVTAVAAQRQVKLAVTDSDFSEAMFATVKDSSSNVNLLIGSKKFVEGWDCWRVSTMGLMHVGKTEGAQIIQLFGRGVRLKGYDWSLKRSGRSKTQSCPIFIEELETLNVFGIESSFMESFRKYLASEGLPGNERRRIFNIPLNVTYDFGKKLKILRPKRKASDGKEYDFKKDGPVPGFGEVPDYLTQNPVIADWYPRIQAIQSKDRQDITSKDQVYIREQHLEFLDFDWLFFEMERYKRERSWYNLNISKQSIRQLLARNDWYKLFMPEVRMEPSDFAGIQLIQEVAAELLKRYCEHYYNYRKREYIEPRLELRELTADDENMPGEDIYQLIVDGDEEQVIQSIEKMKVELASRKAELLKNGDLEACCFGNHLFEPLFHVRRGGKITVLPVALNESEFQFVADLKKWCDDNGSRFKREGLELFLLRNMSRGKGVGFFEAGNFHPDFILWLLVDNKQYVTFVEPHGLLHEGPGSEKIRFHERIKDVEKRLNDPSVVLNSFILSWTKFPQLKWDNSQAQLEEKHVLFMTDDRDHYIEKLFSKLRGLK
ncbi:MAG: restriction endonuclease subunit R [Candidatus Riflebacteria bacterium HGW-Riflebacteria-1]|jgi:superfamily II DNA or RNA helicase|nr:MAG: restriction endonuclease subunit R [Candidatus Riflebacteria bacterium HGW-Riflebacteria-1]